MKKRLVKSEQSNEFKIFGLDISQISLIVSNLILLIGVIFFSWKIINYLILLWLESIIIGFYTIIKMFFARPLSKKERKIYSKNKFQEKFITISMKIIYPIFFIIHYVPIAGFLGIFSIDMLYSILYNNGLPVPFSSLFSSIYIILIPLIIIFISHGISFYINFIRKKEYKTISSSELMLMPYYRIGILYLVYFISLIIFLNLKIPTLSLLFIILVKIISDFYMHNKEHQTPIFIR